MINDDILVNPKTGKERKRTSSNAGYKIMRDDGRIYDSAIDPIDSKHTYTETSILLDDLIVKE